jgi:nucleoside-diphosphate-sugar epimerase
MTAGTQAKDWIHVDDVVGGFLATLGADLPPGETVELGSGQSVSLLEVAHQIYGLIGQGGRPLAGALPSRPGEEPRQVADAERTAALIGWRAAIPLVEGLAKLVKAA